MIGLLGIPAIPLAFLAGDLFGRYITGFFDKNKKETNK